MRNVFYIVQNIKKVNNVAFKAPDDIEEICQKRDFKRFSVECFPGRKNILYQKIWIATYCVGWWVKLYNLLKPGDIVLYQHPLYGIRIAMSWIRKAHIEKGCKFIALIHDLPTLRGHIHGSPKGNKKTETLSDTELLKCFDAVICHNMKMREYLIGQGFNADRLISLEIFDYLMDRDITDEKCNLTCSVAIAGNLNIHKSAYIYKINDRGNNSGLQINLFGSGVSSDHLTEKMNWYGSFDPDELPLKLKGSFGLVWDGNSAETCSGNMGNYLRYNNPHKTSLYLAAGLPVIIWREAAMADFIIKHNVGIVVDSLYELENKINNVTDEEYRTMRSNAIEIGRRLRKGCYFQTALDKALDLVY